MIFKSICMVFSFWKLFFFKILWIYLMLMVFKGLICLLKFWIWSFWKVFKWFLEYFFKCFKCFKIAFLEFFLLVEFFMFCCLILAFLFLCMLIWFLLVNEEVKGLIKIKVSKKLVICWDFKKCESFKKCLFLFKSNYKVFKISIVYFK